MRSVTGKLFRGVFGAVVAGALGFGASHVVASPATATAAAYCTRQDQSVCYEYCYQEYGEEYRARCYKDNFGFIDCECYTVAASAGP